MSEDEQMTNPNVAARQPLLAPVTLFPSRGVDPVGTLEVPEGRTCLVDPTGKYP